MRTVLAGCVLLAACIPFATAQTPVPVPGPGVPPVATLPGEAVPRPVPKPAPGAVVTPDLVYATVDGEKLMLDLAVPKGPGPHPVVVCFHGGAWKAGSRKDLSRGVAWADFGTGGTSLIEALAGRGYAAASVSYRLAPKAKFPAQIQDAKTAVRFLRANANKFDIDPERVGAVGFSAGGHIAALLGTATNEPAFEGAGLPGVSSKVRCVIDFFGPADLTLYTETPGIEQSFMVPLLGGSSAARPELYTKASPVEYVSKESAPFLILHGTADIVVPYIHSKRLHEKLVAAGVKSELVPVRNKGHGWFGADAADSLERSVKFLDANLKAK